MMAKKLTQKSKSKNKVKVKMRLGDISVLKD